MSWRPFEPSREAVNAAIEMAKPRSCNVHIDCDAADEKIRADGGRWTKGWGRVMTAFHCSTEDCKDCFGC